MQRVGSMWGGVVLPSWRMSEDLSWPLTLALYIRDVLKLPATAPFFIPPLLPHVPEHIPVTGPELDIVLADEWSAWFGGLLTDHVEIPRGGSIDYFSLCARAPGFRDLVERHFAAASAAANNAHEAHARHFQANIKADGPVLPKLVRSVEKERGHKSAPFELNLKILPVEGFWLYRVSSQQVLISEVARSDPHQLGRLLGPIVRELA